LIDKKSHTSLDPFVESNAYKRSMCLRKNKRTCYYSWIYS